MAFYIGQKFSSLEGEYEVIEIKKDKIKLFFSATGSIKEIKKEVVEFRLEAGLLTEQ